MLSIYNEMILLLLWPHTHYITNQVKQPPLWSHLLKRMEFGRNTPKIYPVKENT